MKFKKPSRKGLIVIIALMTCSTLGSHHTAIRHEAEQPTVAGIFGNLKDANDSVFARVRNAGKAPGTTKNSRSTFAFTFGASTAAKTATSVAGHQVMKVSGTLSGAQVWTAAYSYEITGKVTIPSGASLTIGPGVLVRNDAGPDSGVIVNDGGQLVIGGINNAPVVFTNTTDARFADLTGRSDSGSADYQTAITVRSGATLNATDVVVAHASTAFSLSGTSFLNGVLTNDDTVGFDVRDGTTAVLGADVENSAQGANVSGGTLAIRGTVHATQGISGCDLGTTHCAVDAAYVDWGSASDPFVTGQVCGNVVASPWLASGGYTGASSLSMKNCNAGSSLTAGLAAAEQNFASVLAARQTGCDPSDQDANGVCNAADNTLGCVQGAFQAIGSNAPFMIRSDLTLADVGVTSNASAMAMAYLNTQVERTPLSATTTALTAFQKIPSVFADLAQAYNTCAS